MKPMRYRSIAAMALITVSTLAVGCTSDEVGICDGDELSSALAAAFENDLVRVGRCRVEGSFTVHPGVTLSGVDREQSVVTSAEDGPVLWLKGGAKAARVVDLTVVSNGDIGIVARGDGVRLGEVAVERVSIDAERGIGMGVENLGKITLDDIRLTGPVTQENYREIPLYPIPEETATHGLVIVRVGDTDAEDVRHTTNVADLHDVEASGFAQFGLLFIDSATEWQGGSSTQNISNGLMVHSGLASLSDVTLCDTYRSNVMSYGGAFVAGAHVETQNVTVCNGELGMFHDSSRVLHVDLEVVDTSYVGVWAQRCHAVELSGQTALLRNALGGTVFVQTDEAIVNGGEIRDTVLLPGVWGLDGRIDVGDGVQVTQPEGPVTLRNLTLSANERVGLLLSLNDNEWDDLQIESISVDGSGDMLGAVAQGARVPDDWDREITRMGATIDNDVAVEDNLPRFQAVEGAIPQIDDTLAFLESL